MLSHEDEQRLAALEQQLLIDDPAFARRLAHPDARRPSARRRIAAALIGVLCALATVAGLLAGSGSLILSGTMLTLAAAWVFHRNRPTRR
jgi:ferric-dicitrate binding protein FerR (iron transport regulator)